MRHEPYPQGADSLGENAGRASEAEGLWDHTDRDPNPETSEILSIHGSHR